MSKLTVNYATEVLLSRGLSPIMSVVSLDLPTEKLTLRDAQYGDYVVSSKSLCPSSSIPLHSKRSTYLRLEKTKVKYVGKVIKGHTILDMFLGTDHGYKSRGFVALYRAACGHESVTTLSILSKHKSTDKCIACSKVTHGGRSKVGGIRKTRTPTYIGWVSNKKSLPARYEDFSLFLKDAGEKPSSKASIVMVDDKPVWVSLNLIEEEELNIIALSIRSAFRRSTYYKEAIKAAKVETTEGTRYQCAACKTLHKRSHVQVDHINPVAPTSGAPLVKEGLIDIIWTDKVQVLDKECHAKKSQAENILRRTNKKALRLAA